MTAEDLKPALGAVMAVKLALEVDDCTPLEERHEAAREYLDDAMRYIADLMVEVEREAELARLRDAERRAVTAAWAGRASSN